MTGFGENASGAKKRKITNTAQAHQPSVDRAEPAIHKPVTQLATTSQGAIGNDNWNATSCPVNYGYAGPAPLDSVPPPNSAFSTVPKMPQLHVTPLRPTLPVGPMHYSIVRPIARVAQQLPTYAYNRPNCTANFNNVNELQTHKVRPVRPEPRYPNMETWPAGQFAAASTSQSLRLTGARSLQLPAQRPANASDDAPDNKEKNENPEYICNADQCGKVFHRLSDLEAHAREHETPAVSADYPERTFRLLREVVRKIQRNKIESISSSVPTLSNTVVRMCKIKEARTVYDKLSRLVECHMEAESEQFLDKSMDRHIFLTQMNECWQSHCRQMVMIRSIFLFLDRAHVSGNPHILPIWDMSLNYFRLHIVVKDPVQTRTVEGLEKLIEEERQGDTKNRTLLESLLRMLSDLDVCNDTKSKLLADAMKKNDGVVRRFLREPDMLECLAHVDKGIREKHKKLLDYLVDQQQWSPQDQKEKRFVSAIVMSILTKGLTGLLDENRISDLLLLYNLYCRIENGLAELFTNFSCYIKEKGETIVMNSEKDQVTVEQELRDFRNRMNNIVKNCFPKDKKFSRSFKEALKIFSYQIANRPTDLVGHNRLLDKIMLLFRFIHDKEVKVFYKVDLSKRLPVGNSATDDAEERLLSTLNQEFTGKLEGMSKDINIAFEPSSGNQQHELILSNLDLGLSILTRGHSPSSPGMAVTLPADMVLYHDIFKKFYQGKLSGRKLQWQPTLGHCVLKTWSSQNMLQAFLFQAPVLYLVNDSGNMSLEEVKAVTNIEDGELRRTLQSMAYGKVRVVDKQRIGRSRFVLNADFTNKLFRIIIDPVLMEKTNEEPVYQIDVAIMGIMKMRKTLIHSDLITELYNQLTLPLADLNKRIEFLINRGYMERDRDNTNQYNYVA